MTAGNSLILFKRRTTSYNLRPKEYFIGYSNQVSWINRARTMKMVHVNDDSVRS